MLLVTKNVKEDILRKSRLYWVFRGVFILFVLGILYNFSFPVSAFSHIEENVSETDDNFTWDNVTVYFAITDRFVNGDETNDHSYGRSIGEVDAEHYQTRQGTFHGGDLAGITKKIEEGYFDELGVNAIWFTAPYEQIHGALCGDGFKYYAYHGYYPLDFTNMDANMGTEDELRKFVDTAHEHGIRVVMDIVMNHVGYVDPVTATEYGFGEVTEDWEEIYYNTSESEYVWSMDYTSETTNGLATLVSEGDWTGWWGNKWVRAISGRYNGYTGSQDDTNYKLCLGGLPDVKTENTENNGIPPILQNKWSKEGRLQEEIQSLDNFFEKSGLPRKNVNYIVKWLTDYVREYGIDGFRCDSVKHVEMEHWGILKEQADIALIEWRKNNPDNIAAKWDEEFWMVGENFDFNNKKDSHYTTGKFNAMINLQFQGREYNPGVSLDYVYSKYSKLINTEEDFNMLTYISSHDTGLGNRGINGGTALLLCPGAVQIYYGDETGRTSNGIEGEQGWRTQMNWESVDEVVLEHYKKIGAFRKEHPAVAMGEHLKLSGNPYTFSRVYKEDKVVICIPERAGEYRIKVGEVFAEGEWIIDAYSGKTYQVSAGTIEVSCEDTSPILLEGTGEITSCVGAKLLYSLLPYTAETIQIQLYATKMQETKYSINDGTAKKFQNGMQITIGGGAAYGETTKLTLMGTGENGEHVEREFTYTKCEEPEVEVNRFVISVSKEEFSTPPYCYVYEDSTVYTNNYPGNLMTDDGDYWTFRSNYMDSAYVILSLGDNGEEWRSTPDLAPGIVVKGQMIYTKETGSLTERPVKKIGTVIVNYQSVDGEILKSIVRKGYVGEEYETSAATIAAYRLITEPANASGYFTEEEIEITYTYRPYASYLTPTATPTAAPTVTPELSPTETIVPAVTKTVEKTPTPVVGNTITPTPSTTPDPTKEITVLPTLKPEVTVTVTPTMTVVPTQILTVTPTVIPTAVITETPISKVTTTPTKIPDNSLSELPETSVTVTPTIIIKQTTIAPQPTKKESQFTFKSSNKKIKLQSKSTKTTYKIYTNNAIKLTLNQSGNGKVYYQIVKKGSKVNNNKWKLVKNQIVIKKDMKACVYVKYTQNEKKVIKKTKGFVFDKTAPKVTVTKFRKLSVRDSGSGVKKITVDGKKVKNGVRLKKGLYKVVAYDKAGNRKNKRIRIK